MPIYEYKCKACNKVFERLWLKTRNAGSDVCPMCGARCRKVMSVVGGFEFKGSGFYHTDYKGKK